MIAEGVAQGRLAGESARSGTIAGQAWVLVGDTLFETDGAGAEEAYRSALRAFGQAPDSLAARANVSYNLGVLAWNADRADEARQQMGAALRLAREAGETEFVRTVADELAGMTP